MTLALRPRTPVRLLAAATACAVSALANAQGSDVILRNNAATPPGRVVRCSPQGVVMGSTATGETTIGWHRVREVTGELADEAVAYHDTSEKAWRAVSRLQRGDIPAAEPLFEELFAEQAGQRGPTAAAVSGGLLRCRLDRGAHTLAVGAWLAWRHATADQTPGTDAVTDSETGLAPGLPPIWLDLPATRVFGQTPIRAEAFGERESELAALYQHAALVESGQDNPIPRLTSTDPGVRLVWEVVAAQSASDAERLAGRRAIERRLRSEPVGWEDAWVRAAYGRSLLREPEPDQQRRGVIELLRVRVTHEHDAPYLAGLALAEAAVTLRTLGDDKAAQVLRRELLDRFPGHPATSWEPVSLWPDPDAPHASRTGRVPAHADARTPPMQPSRSPHG